jgi:hypothetical protein
MLPDGIGVVNGKAEAAHKAAVREHTAARLAEAYKKALLEGRKPHAQPLPTDIRARKELIPLDIRHRLLLIGK